MILRPNYFSSTNFLSSSSARKSMNSIYYNCWLFYLTTFLIVLKGLERLANEEADTPLVPRENFAPAPTFLKDFSAVTFPIFTPCLDAIKKA